MSLDLDGSSAGIEGEFGRLIEWAIQVVGCSGGQKADGMMEKEKEEFDGNCGQISRG